MLYFLYEKKLEEYLIEIKSKIYEDFKNESSGHDIKHLENVLNFSREIQKIEGGDSFTIEISALLHDIHRLMANQNNGVYVTPEESIPFVYEILQECEVPNNYIENILFCIANHEKKEQNNYPIELQIIQDADVLDAVGKRGLDRTIKYCKTYNIPTSDIEIPLDSKEYIPNTFPISTCHYIYRTMIPQAKNLHTKTAMKLAEKEIKVLKDFIKENYYNKLKQF